MDCVSVPEIFGPGETGTAASKAHNVDGMNEVEG